MTSNARIALIGDIGGTHARFAVSDVDTLSIMHFAVFETGMFNSIQDAIRHYLDTIPQRPETAGFSLAGRIDGDSVSMTNIPWQFSREDIQDASGARRVHFVNKFEAMARALPFLNTHDLHGIGGGARIADAPKLLLVASSGFGSAAAIRRGSEWSAITGEAGLAGFGSLNEGERAILSRISGGDEYLPTHLVLSAKGLEAIHAARAELAGNSAPDMTAIQIVEAHEKDDDPRALESLEIFASLLGRVAGDLALTFGARGGVYVGGGLPQKILDVLDRGLFRRNFDKSGEAADYLRQVQLSVITGRDTGLRGAALATSEAFPT